MENKRILIVDDEPFIRRVLKMKLEAGGYEVSIARNGVEALEKIEQESPSVLITDINMPVMDGKALCETVQGGNPGCALFTIVITSGIAREYRTWAQEMANVRFVEKPFSPRNILRLIDEYFLEHV